MATRLDYADFKAEIYNERMNWEAGSPLCAMCNKPAGESFALHHAIVSRKVAMGWAKKLRGLIHHRYNVLVVHQRKCHLQAHASPKLCVAILVMMYGWQEIEDWVNALPWKVPFSWHRGLTKEEAEEMVDGASRGT